MDHNPTTQYPRYTRSAMDAMVARDAAMRCQFFISDTGEDGEDRTFDGRLVYGVLYFIPAARDQDRWVPMSRPQYAVIDFLPNRSQS